MFLLIFTMANRKCGDMHDNRQRPPSSTLQRLFSGPAPPMPHLTKSLPPFPRKFTWQTEAGSTTETIIEPDNSDDSEAKIPDIQSTLGPALVAIPL